MGCDECKELLKVMLDLIDDRNIHMYCELTSVWAKMESQLTILERQQVFGALEVGWPFWLHV